MCIAKAAVKWGNCELRPDCQLEESNYPQHCDTISLTWYCIINLRATLVAIVTLCLLGEPNIIAVGLFFRTWELGLAVATERLLLVLPV